MSVRPLAVRRPEILLALLLSGCLVLLSLQVRRPNGRTVGEMWLLSAMSPLVGAVAGVRGGAADFAQAASTRTMLLRENKRLKAQLSEAQAEVLRLRSAEEDTRRLMELFGMQPQPLPGTRPARLVAVESSSLFRSAMLDRGASDDLETGGVVVSPEGLIGRIVALGAHTSRVQLLSDRTAAVGVVLPRISRAAVAHGNARGGVTVLYVPTIEKVEKGDPVVTSGTDGVYPPDLAIGRISSVNRKSSLFWDLEVSVSADPARASLVFVLPPVPKPDVTKGPGRMVP